MIYNTESSGKSIPDWEYKLNVAESDDRVGKDIEEKWGPRRVLFMHEIACGLFKEIKNKNITSDNLKPEDKKKLESIKYLASKQVELDKKDKYIPVKNFFSALRNFFTIGKFESSAILAKKLSEKVLQKLEEKEKETVSRE